MTSFIFVTMGQDQTQYNTSPSCKRYYIEKGKPFEVTDTKDIEFFRSPRQSGRFKEVGIADKAKSGVKAAVEKIKETIAPKEKEYNAKDLKLIKFSAVREIARELAIKYEAKSGEKLDKSLYTDRTKEQLIKEILDLQEKIKTKK